MGLQQERQLPGRLSFHMLRARSCKKIQLIIVPMLRIGMQFVMLCVTRRFFFFRWIGVRLRSPFRPSATYFDGAKVGKPPRSGFRPDFVGFLRPGTYVALCVVCAIVIEKRVWRPHRGAA
ncbi:hypothetical protein JOE39_000679 [Pseudomonas sp. PvP100]|nr:hypothetical protein [Pseudomonas sp. PvP007]MBP1192700.1 hypothetical protein [Pseudomonas sp. PvP100]